MIRIPFPGPASRIPSFRAFLLLGTTVFLPPHGEGGEKKALLLGVGQYEHVIPLRNPANDVRLLAEHLGAAGFQVVSLVDGDHAAISGAIREFGAALAEGDLGLVYFAGHGLQTAGTNLLLAKNARLEEGGSVTAGVPLSEVLDQLAPAPAALKVILLDCCRDWPLESREAGGLAPVLNVPRRTLIAFSTAANETAEDGEGRNSPFAEALASALEARPPRGLRMQELVENAGRLVAARSRDSQSPALYLDLGSEPYLVFEPTGTPGAPPVAAPIAGGTEASPVQWRTAGELPSMRAGPVDLVIDPVKHEGTTALISGRASSAEAVRLELFAPMAYDRQGRYHGEFAYLTRGSRGDFTSSSLDTKLAPGGQFEFRMRFGNLPADLDGFTTLLLKGQTDNKDFQIPVRHLLLNPAVQLRGLPSSRVQTFDHMVASLVSFTRQGNSTEARILLRSPTQRIVEVNGFAAYDESGSIYAKGAYGVDRIPQSNGYTHRILLPEDQPVLVTLTVNDIPLECAGLTRLEVQCKEGNRAFSVPFLDLPLDTGRSKDNGEPIPELVWRLPATRGPQQVNEVEIGLRQASGSGDQASLEFSFLAALAHRIQVNRFRAYLADGTCLDAGTHGTPNTQVANDRNFYLNIPPAQPICYRVHLDGLPGGTDGFTMFRISGIVDGSAFDLDVPRIALTPRAARDAQGDYLAPPPPSRATREADGMRVDLVSAAKVAERLEVVCRVTNLGTVPNVMVVGAQATLADGTVLKKGEARIGRSLLRHGFLSFPAPVGQPVQISLVYTDPVPAMTTLPKWELMVGDSRKPTVFAFPDITLGATDPTKPDAEASRLERLRR